MKARLNDMSNVLTTLDAKVNTLTQHVDDPINKRVIEQLDDAFTDIEYLLHRMDEYQQ
jgi:hypothetical protein